MDEAIANVLAYCPQYNASPLVVLYYNLTAFRNRSTELPAFICLGEQYSERIRTQFSWFAAIRFVTICIGLPSSTAALLVFNTKPFRTVSFFYHRVINAIELAYLLLLIESVLPWFVGDDIYKSYAYVQFNQWVAGGKSDYALSLSVQVIVVIVAIERSCLCNWPAIYARINKKWVAVAGVTGSLVLCSAIVVPSWFESVFVYDDESAMYIPQLTEFGLSEGCKLYKTICGLISISLMALLVPATGFTLYGLWSMTERKKRLIASASVESATSQELLRQIAVNKNLCILQICEVFPIFLSCVFLSYLETNSSMSTLELILKMSYEEAMEYAKYLYTVNALSVFVVAMDAVAHGTHFFRYLLFSAKFRESVKSVWRKNSIQAGLPTA